MTPASIDFRIRVIYSRAVSDDAPRPPGPRLWAISDLHIGYAANRAALEALRRRPDDWLICCGDVGETLEQLRFAFDVLTDRFARVIWVPGNHELWTHPSDDATDARGEARYAALVEAARLYGVLTPEDAYPTFAGHTLAPMFLGYDYSWAPAGMRDIADVKAWAGEHGIYSADERFLHSDPHPDKAAWCRARVEATAKRLDAVEGPTVLINHYPLRRDLVRLARIPRFVPWCGTAATEDWHTRYRATACVNGHLHMRATDWRDGVRFEEVAVGYPRHWKTDRGLDHYLREILPAADIRPPAEGRGGPEWHW